MAVSVVSVLPINNDNLVVRDPLIKIEFSEELANIYLTSEFFKLYIQPGYTGTIQLSITKDITNPKIIKLVPLITLAANTTYAIWVMGDKNITDATPLGIKSIAGNLMLNNFVASFTTGTKTTVEVTTPTEIGGYNPVPSTPGGNIVLTPAQIQALANANDWLDVLKTTPADGATQVSGLTDIKVFFDKTILTYGLPEEIVEITAEDFIFGQNALIPTIIDVTPGGNKLLITTDGAYSYNALYTVNVFSIGISGVPSNGIQEGLPTDYSFSFSSPICPACTSPSIVRHRGGSLIPSAVSDSTINRYILDASVWAIESTGFSIPSGSCCPDGLTDLVTCKVLYDVASNIGAGSLLGIKEKTLADLTIVYNSEGIKSQLQDLQECINEQLASLGFISTPIGIGIKSLNAIKRPYVTGKRIIHNYDGGRFTRSLRRKRF